MNIQEAIDEVTKSCADVSRPQVFIRGTCECDECMEHNATMASSSPETIGLNELGKVGWDPICFASDAAFAYYLPAIVRLALTSVEYLTQFECHINSDRIRSLTSSQRHAVAAAVGVLMDVHRQELELCGSRTIYEAMQKELEQCNPA